MSSATYDVNRCAAESYGAKCTCGLLTDYAVVYQYLPSRSGQKSLCRDIKVPLCVGHYKQITAVPANDNKLPELYGFCSGAILDGLFVGLRLFTEEEEATRPIYVEQAEKKDMVVYAH